MLYDVLCQLRLLQIRTRGEGNKELKSSLVILDLLYDHRAVRWLQSRLRQHALLPLSHCTSRVEEASEGGGL